MLVTPYGDPNAHGTIGRTLTFIRRRGIVYARPYRIPFDPKSQAQLDQRQLFREAKLGWDALSSESRDYYNTRAQGQTYTGYNYYISKYMLDQLPSETPIQVSDITNAWIGYLRSTNFNGWNIYWKPDPTGANYGHIWDNENIYKDGVSYLPARNLKIGVNKISQDIDIQFRDTFTIEYDGAQILTIYLKALDSNAVFFVAQDGSTYYDSAMKKLAAAAYV